MSFDFRQNSPQKATEDNFVTQPHIISSCLFPWIPKNPLLFKSYIISPKAKKKKRVQFILSDSNPQNNTTNPWGSLTLSRTSTPLVRSSLQTSKISFELLYFFIQGIFIYFYFWCRWTCWRLKKYHFEIPWPSPCKFF